MKTVFLHGMGQTAHDWDAVLSQASLPDVDCPELSALRVIAGRGLSGAVCTAGGETDIYRTADRF